jgi:ABC-2 type transport system permease protein
MKINFSVQRFWAIMRKEFILMKRDPAVIIIMAILPLILVCLAGYTINNYPQHVPTALINLDNTNITRNFIQEIKNTNYFSFVDATTHTDEAYRALKTNKVLLVMTIPADFSKKFIRNENPSLLIEDGGIDSISTTRALITLMELKEQFLKELETGTLFYLKQPSSSFQLNLHRIYNPEHITQYNVVPGMIGFVVMLTMLMITTVIAFRDVQGGTLECLLASPTKPLEILMGEMLSYIVIGYSQLILGIILSYYLFKLPFNGNIWLLLLCAFPYIIAELSLGLAIATFCASQFQAVQIINLFIALAIILSGFAFPIFSMPHWAQVLSNFIPLTHFLQILRGIMIKGNDFTLIWQNLWPILIYCVVMITIAVSSFQRHFR